MTREGGVCLGTSYNQTTIRKKTGLCKCGIIWNDQTGFKIFGFLLNIFKGKTQDHSSQYRARKGVEQMSKQTVSNNQLRLGEHFFSFSLNFCSVTLTVSADLPFSQPNSPKLTVNVYNGQTKFYFFNYFFLSKNVTIAKCVPTQDLRTTGTTSCPTRWSTSSGRKTVGKNASTNQGQNSIYSVSINGLAQVYMSLVWQYRCFIQAKSF
jgi:hypothetical protein